MADSNTSISLLGVEVQGYKQQAKKQLNIKSVFGSQDCIIKDFAKPNCSDAPADKVRHHHNYDLRQVSL